MVTFTKNLYIMQESEDEEYDAAEYPQRVGRQKHVLDIDIQFNDNRRGGGRGRGQRSGPRGNRTNPRAPGTTGAGTGSGTTSTITGATGVTGGATGGGTASGSEGGRPDRRFREEQVLRLYELLFSTFSFRVWCHRQSKCFKATFFYMIYWPLSKSFQ